MANKVSENGIKKILNKISEENAIVITSKRNIEFANNPQIYSVDRFCEHLIKKSPLYEIPKVLSLMACEFIINEIASSELSEVSGLEKLINSGVFSYNLYKIFGNLLELNIEPKQFIQIVKKVETKLTPEDFERANIIANIFDKYCLLLNEKGYIDSRALPIFALKLLHKYPNYLAQLKKKINKIIINSQEPQTEPVLELLNLFNNVEEMDFNLTEDGALNAIKTKYISNQDIDKSVISSDVKLLTFNDTKDEAGYIAKEILTEINAGKAQFSDYVIAIGNPSAIITFEDVFNYAKLPFNSRKADNTYRHFVTKIIQYCEICKGCQTLSSNTLSKAQSEFLHSEINLNFEYRLNDILQDKFAKNKLLNLKQNSNEKSLIEFAKRHTPMLNQEDAEALKNEVYLIEYLCKIYNENNVRQFITAVVKNTQDAHTDDFKQLLAQLFKQINLIEAVSPINVKGGITFEAFKKLIENPITLTEGEIEDCIKLTTLKNALSYSGKTVYVTGLNETSIPATNNTVKFISAYANDTICAELPKEFKGITQTNEQIVRNGAQLLYDLLANFENINISIHKYQDKKEIAPSIFFQYLQSVFPKQSKEIDETFNKEQEAQEVQTTSTTINDEITIAQDEILYLSPSSIGYFQKCPRKFFLGRLLGLSEESNFSANYGTIVHAIMENFNKNYLDRYSKNTLLELTDILFSSAESPQNAIDKGFQEYETQLIAASDLLSLKEMKTDFLKAIDEMEKNRFFDQVPTSITSEKKFQFSLPEIPNVIFDGKIDAIYEFNGKYDIIDFKTGKPLKKALSAYISETGVELNTESKIKEFPYQIPIYYLATQYAEGFEEMRGNIGELGLLYLHPDNKNGGYHKNTITSDVIDEYKDQIIRNLNETIVSKIREYSTFQALGDYFSCAFCPYPDVCDKTDEEEE